MDQIPKSQKTKAKIDKRNQTKELLHVKGNNQKPAEATCRVEENSLGYIHQEDIQNLYVAQSSP